VAQAVELCKPEALCSNSNPTKNKTKTPDKRKIESGMVISALVPPLGGIGKGVRAQSGLQKSIKIQLTWMLIKHPKEPRGRGNGLCFS
jgi:hypothetical protein